MNKFIKKLIMFSTTLVVAVGCLSLSASGVLNVHAAGDAGITGGNATSGNSTAGNATSGNAQDNQNNQNNQGDQKPPTHAHIAGKAVMENVIEATATTDGSYDEVRYCLLCKEEISRTKKITPATGSVNPDVVEAVVVNSKGKQAVVTATAVKNDAGILTGYTVVTKVSEAAKNTSFVVTAKQDITGKTLSATAEIVRSSADGNLVIAGSVLDQIKEAAGKGVKVDVSAKAVDSAGKTRYTVKGTTASLKKGTKLKMYRVDVKTGAYIAVNNKTYTVNNVGSVTVPKLAKATYQLVTNKEATAIKEDLKKTIALKKAFVNVTVANTTTLAFKDTLDKRSVKSVTYSSSDTKIATVDKTGKVTAKKKGTAVISAKVVLKDGATKTVSETVIVK